MAGADTRNSRTDHRGFTLVELMISIALVLLLMAGVTAVFKTSSDTIRTGLALGSITRDQRGATQVFGRDFVNVVPASQQPCIIIHSEQDFAFMDRNDITSDADGNVQTIDLNNNGIEGEASVPGEIIAPWQYNYRNHRLDTLSLFVSSIANPFQRQTGNQGGTLYGPSVVNQETTNEAWLWYGHVRQPDNRGSDPRGQANGGNYWLPGETVSPPPTNDNNLFVNQWVLGRVAILLKSSPSGDHLRPGLTGGSVMPLAVNTPAWDSGNNLLSQPPSNTTNWIAAYSRFDIAQATIHQFKDYVTSAVSVRPGPTGAIPSPFMTYWYQDLDYRFNCKPFAQRSASLQTTAEEMAMATPFFQKGVSQFIVEFAGDFVTQDNNPASPTYGNVQNSLPRPTDAPGVHRSDPDGTLDFYVVGGVRHIQWYGLPRHSDGSLTGTPDVIPLRQELALAPTQPVVLPAFEKNWPSTPNMLNGETYICAWSPAELNPPVGTPAFKPSLIRITITLTDPSGRLPEGQTFEYVYALPQ